MDVAHTHKGYVFVWDSGKAASNLAKHGVSFEQACDVFFDPFYWMGQDPEESEERWDIIGYSSLVGRESPLFVVVAEKGEEAWRIVSARFAEAAERRRYEEGNDTD
jgi:uncharacterized protein